MTPLLALAFALQATPAEAAPAPPVTVGAFQMSYPFPSPDGRTLVFQGNFDGRWQLYEMLVENGAIRRLHQSARDDTHPAVSPDGATVAFISNRDGNDDVWLLDRRTGEAGALAPHPGKDGHPKFSPDGRWIVFNRTFDPADTEGDRGSAIVRVPVAGGPVEVLSDVPAVETFPSFSPDGRSIAFLEWDPIGPGLPRNADLVTVELASGRRTRLTRSAEFDAYPWWAADGRIYWSVVLTGPRGPEPVLHRIDPAGGAAERLGALDGLAEMRAIPSADGTTVWFNRVEGGRGMILRMPLPAPR